MGKQELAILILNCFRPHESAVIHNNHVYGNEASSLIFPIFHLVDMDPSNFLMEFDLITKSMNWAMFGRILHPKEKE